MALDKPTITEYDQSFGQMTQYAFDDYVKLRTYILGLGVNPADGVISITYSDLLALYNGSSLVPGQFYKITDFQTVQSIPNTVDTNTGPVEPLTIQAVDVNAFNPRVFSYEYFPEDIIFYDITRTDFGATKGFIYYREDPTKNNSGWFDIRYTKYRRWDDGSGNYVVVTDNANASQDFFAIGGLTDYNFCTAKGVHFKPSFDGSLNFLQPNNVVDDTSSDVSFSMQSRNNTVIGTCYKISMDYGTTNNYCLTGTNNVYLGTSSFDNKIGSSGARLTIGALASNITIGNNCKSVIIGNTCTNVNIGNNANIVDLGEGSGTIIIGTTNQRIKVGKFNTGIIIGNTATGVNILNDCQNITIGANCTNLYFGSGINGRTVLDNNQDRRDYIDSAEYNITYDFSTGGAIGTYNLDAVGPYAYVTWSPLHTLTALVGGGTTTVALGVATDDPAGIDGATSISDAKYTTTTPVNLLPVPSTSANWTTVTTAERNLILTIAADTVTSGIILLKVQVKYTNL